MKSKNQKKISFDAWIDQKGCEWIGHKLKVHPRTVRVWQMRKGDPRVDHMRRIKRLTKGMVTYDMMIDRRPITTKGTYTPEKSGGN